MDYISQINSVEKTLGKAKSSVKAGSWSTVEPPPGGPITVLFSAKIHKK